jgi:hypothetical protein
VSDLEESYVKAVECYVHVIWPSGYAGNISPWGITNDLFLVWNMFEKVFGGTFPGCNLVVFTIFKTDISILDTRRISRDAG